MTDSVSTNAPIDDILRECHLDDLKDATPDGLAHRLHRLGARAETLDLVTRGLLRNATVERLKDARIARPANLVDTALASVARTNGAEGSRSTVSTLPEPDPWADAVDGAVVLDMVARWIERYVHLPAHAYLAIALWIAATWFRDDAYFAPVLAILSATKRCGKTLLLDLLRYVVRRGVLTSSTGVTAPLIFRRNEAEQPTFLIDEAEKLAGRHADRDLVGMLNVGYRRGAKAQRLGEANGDYKVREFDAFGFRALASIGTLWDTIIDRSIVVPMERKPNNTLVERFAARRVATEGAELARQLRRWAEDHQGEYGAAEDAAPRPVWLHDRECDNWSSLFAVAAIAGGQWPEQALEAARGLRLDADDESDHGERLVHDIRDVFKNDGNPAVIKSGDLVRKLNEIETAPWGDYRRGDGLSTHRLSALLKPFKVRSRRAWTAARESVRGYWLVDLKPVFQRYPRLKCHKCHECHHEGGECEACDTGDTCDSRGGTLGMDDLEQRLEREGIQNESRF
jgi:hypothetical protein